MDKHTCKGKRLRMQAATSTGVCWRPPLTLAVLAVLATTAGFVSGASNTAGCDWTGSGLSTARANREVISIYLRCTAGRIVWNYPRGAIRVLLRKPAHLQDNFRACLKIYPPGQQQQQQHKRPTQSRARIYLEAPRRLIGLFGGSAWDDRHQLEQQQQLSGGHPYDGEVLVKCFRSINGQVALYVEAEETPFANAPTIFKYNLEFINNKHYSMRPTSIADAAALLSGQNYGRSDDSDDDRDDDDDDPSDDDDDTADTAVNRLDNGRVYRGQVRQQITVTATPTPIGTPAASASGLPLPTPPTSTQSSSSVALTSWWSPNVRSLWRRWTGAPSTTAAMVPQQPLLQEAAVTRRGRMAVDEQIAGRLGETYEICRPCTDVETAHAFCTSEIVTRGTMFGVQQRPRLATNEIYVNRTRLLRYNLFDILSDPETATVTVTAQPPSGRFSRPAARSTAAAAPTAAALLTFHTPLHCATAHERGEFVFMGRRRFEEMMVICAPRLAEWAATVERLQRSGEAPCVLSS